MTRLLDIKRQLGREHSAIMDVEWTPRREPFPFGFMNYAEQPGIRELHFDGLISIAEGMEIYAMPDLEIITMKDLVRVDSGASIYINPLSPLLTQVSFPALEYIGNYFTVSGTNLKDVYFPVLSRTNGIFSFNESALSVACVNRIFSTLAACAGFRGYLSLSGGTNALPTGQGIVDLDTLTMRGVSVLANWNRYVGTSDAEFASYTGGFAGTRSGFLDFQNTSVVSLSNSHLTHIYSFGLQGASYYGGPAISIYNHNESLTSLSLPNVIYLDSAQVSNCPSLTEVNLPSWIPSYGHSYIFQYNALNAGSVNHILSRAAANTDYTSGILDLSGGTNAAPTGQGITDKNTMISRGVYVYTN